MILKKMIDLYNYLKENNKSLIDNPPAILEELAYNINSSIIDFRYLANKYRNLFCNETILINDSFDYEALQMLLQVVFISNEYKYKKLKQTIDYDYNYDKNYNLTKISTTTDTFGNTEQNNVNGATKLTYDYSNAKIDTTTEKNAMDSSTDLVVDNKVIQTNNAHIDTTSSDAFTNKITQNTHKDKHEVKEEVFGDTSVRAVADTIKAEREIADFSIFDVIFSDIMKEISIYIFE